MTEQKINGVAVGAFEKAIKRIARRFDGVCPPAMLVKEAERDESIHSAFEWDDTQAAQDWRVHQARRILNSIRVVVEKRDEPVMAYVHVTHVTPKGQVVQGYMRTERALSGSAHDQVLRDALSALNGHRRRYGQLTELAPLWAALDEIQGVVAA